jgi:hypothetical protein
MGCLHARESALGCVDVCQVFRPVWVNGRQCVACKRGEWIPHVACKRQAPQAAEYACCWGVDSTQEGVCARLWHVVVGACPWVLQACSCVLELTRVWRD